MLCILSKGSILILIKEPPCYVPSPQHPAGPKAMNSYPMCSQMDTDHLDPVQLVPLFGIASPGLRPRAFDPVAKGVFESATGNTAYLYFRAPRKACLLRLLFHHAAQSLIPVLCVWVHLFIFSSSHRAVTSHALCLVLTVGAMLGTLQITSTRNTTGQ